MGRIVYVQNRKGVKITHITHKGLFSPPVFIKGGEQIGVRITLYVIEKPLDSLVFIGGVFVQVKISLTHKMTFHLPPTGLTVLRYLIAF